MTVLVRSPSKLEAPGALTVVEGDVMDADAVRPAIGGGGGSPDAVIFAAGPVKGSPPNMLSTAASNIISAMKDAGVRRLVWLTGAGVMDARDEPSFSRRIIRGLMKVVAGSVLSDSETAYRAVVGSGLDYTVVRPPMLSDEPGGSNLQAGYTPPKPIPVGRGDLARFLLEAAEKNEYVNESPLVTYTTR